MFKSTQSSASTPSLTSLLSQIELIEYTLLIDTPSLHNSTLTQHLSHHHPFSSATLLFNDPPSQHNPHTYFCLRVPSPNLYVQKLRGIYYLILHQVYEHMQEQFLPPFTMLHLMFYRSSKTTLVRKKYLCEFLQFLDYHKGRKGVVKENLNKYPLIDEILIDLLIELVEDQKDLSADDNFNIVNFLNGLGLDASAQTLAQIRLYRFLIKTSEHCIEVVELEKEREEEEGNNSTAEISLEDEFDTSNVLPFSRENVFPMDNSLIHQLNGLVVEDSRSHLGNGQEPEEEPEEEE